MPSEPSTVPSDDRPHAVVLLPLQAAVLSVGDDPLGARAALLASGGTLIAPALARRWVRKVVDHAIVGLRTGEADGPSRRDRTEQGQAGPSDRDGDRPAVGSHEG